MTFTREDAAATHAIVFDVIGTLVDEDREFSDTVKKVAGEARASSVIDTRADWARRLDEAMSDVVHGTTPWRPHAELVANAGRQAFVHAGYPVTPAMTKLLAGVDSRYQAWPDVTEAMRFLRRDRLIVGLSNGDLSSLAQLALVNDLPWHAVVSTSAIQNFKPHGGAYRIPSDGLGMDPARTLFVAAHPWDLRAAAEFGYRTAYVARPRAERPLSSDRFDLYVSDLLELARLLRSLTK